MKKYLLIIILFVAAFNLTGCNNFSKKAEEFKKEYESLNGKTNKSGKEHRTVKISEKNPYIKVTPEEIVKMIEKEETFYLYVGDSMCPWCRSVIEKSIEVAKENNIEKIYYIDIWDEEGNEILRDKYELKDGNPTIVSEGTDSYKKLLEYFNDVLNDYTLTNENGDKINVGEKRIFAPNYFYIEKGIVKKMAEGISDKQKDSREELTDEILEDEQKIFEEFFAEVCTDRC